MHKHTVDPSIITDKAVFAYALLTTDFSIEPMEETWDSLVD